MDVLFALHTSGSYRIHSLFTFLKKDLFSNCSSIMPVAFDVEHVLANISEQDKIALLSGNTETTTIFEDRIR